MIEALEGAILAQQFPLLRLVRWPHLFLAHCDCPASPTRYFVSDTRAQRYTDWGGFLCVRLCTRAAVLVRETFDFKRRSERANVLERKRHTPRTDTTRYFRSVDPEMEPPCCRCFKQPAPLTPLAFITPCLASICCSNVL
jgi:hypothetical protein